MPDVRSLRIPLKYLANLLTAGDEKPVATRARADAGHARLHARQDHRRRDRRAIAQKVGLTGRRSRTCTRSWRSPITRTASSSRRASRVDRGRLRLARLLRLLLRQRLLGPARRQPVWASRRPRTRWRLADEDAQSSFGAPDLSQPRLVEALPAIGRSIEARRAVCLRAKRGSRTGRSSTISRSDLIRPAGALRVLLFDRTRSLSLHLFEHVHGESRDRGQAMVDLIKLYEDGGFTPTPRNCRTSCRCSSNACRSEPADEASPCSASPRTS
jgi:hypothetical protein